MFGKSYLKRARSPKTPEDGGLLSQTQDPFQRLSSTATSLNLRSLDHYIIYYRLTNS